MTKKKKKKNKLERCKKECPGWMNTKCPWCKRLVKQSWPWYGSKTPTPVHFFDQHYHPMCLAEHLHEQWVLGLQVESGID